MAADRQETDRAAVKTYVPRYQKEEWQAHADELGMTQSEFVRVMVQAGRAEFSVDDPEPSPEADDTTGGSALEDRILDVLRAEGVCSWDELVEQLTDDIEARMEDALQELQRENHVGYSGREGGYTLLDDTNGSA